MRWTAIGVLFSAVAIEQQPLPLTLDSAIARADRGVGGTGMTCTTRHAVSPVPPAMPGPGPTPLDGDWAGQRDERQRSRLVLDMQERLNHLRPEVRRVGEPVAEHPSAVLSDQPGKCLGQSAAARFDPRG